MTDQAAPMCWVHSETRMEDSGLGGGCPRPVDLTQWRAHSSGDTVIHGESNVTETPTNRRAAPPEHNGLGVLKKWETRVGEMDAITAVTAIYTVVKFMVACQQVIEPTSSLPHAK